jgi:hypothetical protein
MSLVHSVGLVNESNAHYSNPGFSSKVGAVTGCGGSGSELSLQQKGLYQVMKAGGKRRSKHNRTSKRNKKYTKSKSGKKHKKSRSTVRGKKRIHRGGNGYGMDTKQVLASTSGTGLGGSVHLAEFSKYTNEGQNSDTNMDASKQSGGMKNRRPASKSKKAKKAKKAKRKHTYKKRRMLRKQKGGYSQYMSNVANAHIYSLGGKLSASESALASPPPFTPSNNCLNSWKHLGDTEPYNKVIA